MRNIYYLIWADSIISIRKHHPNKNNWGVIVFFLNTWLIALNIWVLFLWLKYFRVCEIPTFKIDFFPGDIINGFLSFSIVFAFFPGLINYFLIFHNKRYEKIIEKYKFPPNRIAFYYSAIILILSFFSSVLYNLIK